MGAMICLRPEPSLAERLAVLVPGTVAENLHLTLVWADWKQDESTLLERMRTVAMTLAAETGALAGTINGVARFATPDGDALVVTADVPELGQLRAALVSRLEAAEVPFSLAHGFTPHITLAFLSAEAPSPIARIEPIPCGFGALELWAKENAARESFSFRVTALSANHGERVHLDALALPSDPPTELRLFRDGWNETSKGKFLLDAAGAAEILQRFQEHGVELAMDFDHGTFTADGKKRDVPGYIGALEYRVGAGLFATKIRWTAVGLKAISPGKDEQGNSTVPEYRYLSPAIRFDSNTRRITALDPVALVTWPATHNAPPLMMGAGDSSMNVALLTLLSLAHTATEAEVLAATTRIKEERNQLLSALGAQDVPSALGAIEAHKATRTALENAQRELTAVRAASEAKQREELFAKGIAKGYAREFLAAQYGEDPLAKLAGFVENAPTVVPKQNFQSPATNGGGAKLSYRGKSYEQLGDMERAQLASENFELFTAMRNDAEERGAL